jgi:hypothetical protein
MKPGQKRLMLRTITASEMSLRLRQSTIRTVGPCSTARLPASTATAARNSMIFCSVVPNHFSSPLIFSLATAGLRLDALIERKAELRRLLASRSARAQRASRVCYVDHVERTGSALFDLICQRDLEGIAAKLKHGHYATEREHSIWIKIKIKSYSQAEGGRSSLRERSLRSPFTLVGIRVR